MAKTFTTVALILALVVVGMFPESGWVWIFFASTVVMWIAIRAARHEL